MTSNKENGDIFPLLTAAATFAKSLLSNKFPFRNSKKNQDGISRTKLLGCRPSAPRSRGELTTGRVNSEE